MVVTFGFLGLAFYLTYRPRRGAAPAASPRASIKTINKVILWGAVCLALVQIPFIINVFHSIWKGKKIANDNPWNATTLEWQTPTPPPHGNFDKEPTVYRGPYDYSVPGSDSDFTPQNTPEAAKA